MTQKSLSQTGSRIPTPPPPPTFPADMRTCADSFRPVAGLRSGGADGSAGQADRQPTATTEPEDGDPTPEATRRGILPRASDDPTPTPAPEDGRLTPEATRRSLIPRASDPTSAPTATPAPAAPTATTSAPAPTAAPTHRPTETAPPPPTQPPFQPTATPAPTQAPDPTATPRPTATPMPTPTPTPRPRFTPLSPAQTSVETDKEALVALFNATEGETWDGTNSWLGRGAVGGWQGVTTDANGRVIGLELYGLIGDLPPELGNLTSLIWLLISSSQLDGGNTAGAGQPRQSAMAGHRIQRVGRGNTAAVGQLDWTACHVP